MFSSTLHCSRRYVRAERRDINYDNHCYFTPNYQPTSIWRLVTSGGNASCSGSFRCIHFHARTGSFLRRDARFLAEVRLAQLDILVWIPSVTVIEFPAQFTVVSGKDSEVTDRGGIG